jgi:phospholipid/cholesterol/gamma-HCH transport system permease protein
VPRVAVDPGYQLSISEVPDGISVAIRGRVAIANVQRLRTELTRVIGGRQRLVLDLSEVDYFDSGGGALLLQLRQALAARGARLEVVGSTPDIDGLLRLFDDDALLGARPAPPARGHPIERLGAAALDWRADAGEMVRFVGEMVIGLLQALRHPTQIRWAETWDYMARSGQDALPIVALISFLMGLITAFQAAVQLQQFGADIYVANLVGLSITRELGPLMTAIIAAGRSGAAFAAEIGTMKVSEEVDALAAMGLDRTRFLVTPKLIALVVMLPCLTLFADLVGILGGLFVANFGLDIPSQVYFRQMALYMTFDDIRVGLVKSVVFAILIAAVGCLRGFQARGGAESVGRITTSAIVSGIFSIIVADAIFTVLFYEW